MIDREARLALLQAQSDLSPDGILLVSAEGRILSYNRRFAELWRIPDQILDSGSDEAALDWVLDSLVDPRAFRRRVAYLYDHPNQQGRDELRLTDGRVFDRYSVPVSTDGRVEGRIWYFRDVTAEKATEARAIEGARRLAFLAEAGLEMSSSLDYRQVLQRIVKLCVPFLADWCFVDVAEQNGSVHRVALAHDEPEREGIARELRTPQPDPGARHGVQQVIASGEATLVEKVTDDILVELSGGSDERLALLRKLDPLSYMIVPLRARGRTRTLGAIIFVGTRLERVFDGDDLALAEELARRAAIAIDNSLVYSERAHVAMTLQRTLLPPHLPEVPGFELGAAYEPAGEGSEVGGDFYDVFRLGRHRWAVAMGDVCGKGANAATLTGLARFTLRAAAMQRKRPSRILSVLNEAIARSEERGERFCAALFMTIDVNGSLPRAWVACGGHPLPLVLRAGGGIEYAGSPGTVLGIVDYPELVDHEVRLEPGDLVVLYTDGCTGPGDSAGGSGEGLFAELVESCRGIDAASAARKLLTGVREAGQSATRDDAAVPTLRVLERP